MFDVVVLTPAEGCSAPRVPVLALRDALTEAGARIEVATVASDAEIDQAVARFDAPPRPDGLPWPADDSKTRLVVATAATGQLRAVVRRLVRRYAPPPRSRPPDLPAGRTVPDLPPIGILPMAPGGLADQLGLPSEPRAVADAVIGARVRRLDLLRTDSGSVTLDGALLGGTGDDGRATRWHGRVEVDDALLSDGTDPLLACAVANGSTYCDVDGLPLIAGADPADGTVEAAVAVPVLHRSLLGGRRVRVEVRRARGRAVAVTPSDGVAMLDDGVTGTLDRRRSWWVEPLAWAVYFS